MATPETQLISLCQRLAYAYQALLRTLNYSYIGHPNNQEEGMEKTTHLVRMEEASPESKREHQKRQPVAQQSSHKNKRLKKQKSYTSQKPPGPKVSCEISKQISAVIQVSKLSAGVLG